MSWTLADRSLQLRMLEKLRGKDVRVDIADVDIFEAGKWGG